MKPRSVLSEGLRLQNVSTTAAENAQGGGAGVQPVAVPQYPDGAATSTTQEGLSPGRAAQEGAGRKGQKGDPSDEQTHCLCETLCRGGRPVAGAVPTTEPPAGGSEAASWKV